MSAIAKREPSALDTLVTDEFPRAVLDVVLRQACPKDMPPDEQYVFLLKCRQTGLNPLAGEALCVPRNDKNKGRVYTFQPTAEGMRARAARFPEFAKVDGDAVYENDLCEVDHSSGTVTHRYNLAKKRGSLVAAWGRVVKKDGTVVIHVLPVSARSGTTDFWRADQGGMLAKCAKVAALREAFPVAFAGAYVAEEMGAERPMESEAKLLPPAPADGPRCPFGDHKGRRLGDMTPDELRAAVAFGEQKLAEGLPLKLKENVEKGLADLRAVLPPSPALPAPGLITDFEVVEKPEVVPVDEAGYVPPEPTQEQLDAEAVAKAAKKGKPT